MEPVADFGLPDLNVPRQEEDEEDQVVVELEIIQEFDQQKEKIEDTNGPVLRSRKRKKKEGSDPRKETRPSSSIVQLLPVKRPRLPLFSCHICGKDFDAKMRLVGHMVGSHQIKKIPKWWNNFN